MSYEFLKELARRPFKNNKKEGPGMVKHICNPSYLGDRDRRLSI
jgi:hypothetical protein